MQTKEEFLELKLTPQQEFVREHVYDGSHILGEVGCSNESGNDPHIWVNSANIFLADDGVITNGRACVICFDSNSSLAGETHNYIRLNEQEFDDLATLMGYERKDK